MICENCKERPASVIITQGYVGESTEQHLCEKCAFQSEAFHFNPNQEPLSIQQFLSQWFNGADSLQQQEERQSTVQELQCPECSLTFNKFLDNGKFGCATCYETFRERLPRVFEKLHSGHSTHIGKIPVSYNKLFAVKRKIEEVRVKMQQAVSEERFEEAAALRDEANALQQDLVIGVEDDDVS